MIQQAPAQFEIDLARSFVVGDKLADVGLAANAARAGILVKTGYGAGRAAAPRRHRCPARRIVAETVFEAASWILAESGFPKETR